MLFDKTFDCWRFQESGRWQSSVFSDSRSYSMEALLLSTALVALAEMGDKTQLLSLLLAARYPKSSLAIILGILVATLANHALAGGLGALFNQWLSPAYLKWLLVVVFLVMGAWLLVPDRLDGGGLGKTRPDWQVFFVVLGVFFLAEMGDKTQVATLALGARYATEVVWVVIGTTLGMMLANMPVVFLGGRFAERIPLRLTRVAAAVLAFLFAAYSAIFV